MFTKAAAGSRNTQRPGRARPRRASRPLARAASAGCPRSTASCRSACLAEEIETPGRRPDPRADHDRRQPGAQHAERRAARRGAGVARLHGERRHLPERDDAPRRRHPAGPSPLERDRTTTSRSASSRSATSPTTRRRSCRRRRASPTSGRSCCACRHRQRPGRDTPTSPRSTTSSSASWSSREVASPGSPLAGRDAERACSPRSRRRRGPERMLDLMLRTGPYGDGFGAKPDGLTLGGARGPPARHRPRPARAAHPRGAAHAVGQDRARARPRSSPTSRACAAALDARQRAPRARRPPPPALQQLVDAQPRRPGEGQGPLHAAGPPRRRRPPRPRATARPRAVASRVGAVEAPVEVTDAIMPGVVSLPHGWGHDRAGRRDAGRRRRTPA